MLRDARASLPDDVAPHTVRRRGHPGEEIVAELERGGYDLLVLGSRRRVLDGIDRLVADAQETRGGGGRRMP